VEGGLFNGDGGKRRPTPAKREYSFGGDVPSLGERKCKAQRGGAVADRREGGRGGEEKKRVEKSLKKYMAEMEEPPERITRSQKERTSATSRGRELRLRDTSRRAFRRSLRT